MQDLLLGWEYNDKHHAPTPQPPTGTICWDAQPVANGLRLLTAWLVAQS